MMEAEVATQPAPSDAEAKEFYDKNPDKFKQDESVRASHILFRVDENADAATKKKATRRDRQRVLKQAQGGRRLRRAGQEALADGSAAQGGDLNFFAQGQMVRRSTRWPSRSSRARSATSSPRSSATTSSR